MTRKPTSKPRRGIARAGVVAVLVHGALAADAHAQATFTPMGSPPDPQYKLGSIMYVTNDGTVLHWITKSPGYIAMTWHPATGYRQLPSLVPGGQAIPRFAEPSGRFIPGGADDSSNNRRPVLWIDGQAPIKLGDPPQPYTYGDATGVSWDGTIVAGHFSELYSGEAFLYEAGSGLRMLGWLPGGGPWTGARQLPQFGDAILTTVDDGMRLVGARWTQAKGWESLGVPPGWLDSRIEACSRDGRVAVGRITRSNGLPGIARWTEGSGWLDLGLGDASSVSGDGWVVMAGGTSKGATFWNPIDGFRVLQDVLENEYGVTMPGWKLTGSWLRISDNGRFIAGIGLNPQGKLEGWLVELPPFCYADCDRSSGKGVLDLFDFLCFVNRFNAQDPYGNCDNDGAFDLFDFLCFLNHFNAGCP